MRPLLTVKIILPSAVLVLFALLAGCSNTNRWYDPAKPHHTPQGFQNNYPPNPAYARPDNADTGWIARIGNWVGAKPNTDPVRPLRPVAPELAFIHGNPAAPALTWIGHATFLLQTGSGVNILTDPIFEERASPVPFAGPKRFQPPGVALADLPHIDAILISHSHYDHLSKSSLRALYAQAGGPPKLFAPLGVDAWLADNVTGGDRTHIVKLDWWDSASVKGMDIHLLPVQHWSTRTPWDRNETLWGAYAVRRPGFSFFFSGDFAYSRDIQDIADRFDGFDLAAIGIGAYEPVWYRNSHATPEEAVRTHQALRVRQSVGMHWGTFALGRERLDQPIDDLATARRTLGVADEAFFVMQHGETFKLRLPTKG